MRRGRRFQISLTVTILTAFSLVFVTVMGFTALATYRVDRQAAITSAMQAMVNLASSTAARTAALVEPLYAAITIAPVLPDVSVGAGDTLSATERSFRDLLDVLPQARGVSAASADGALLQMLNLDAMAPDRRLALAVPDGARFVVRAVSSPVGGDREASLRFLDHAGRVLERRKTEPGPDPRSEIWYRTALNSKGVTTTVLYAFPTLGMPGVSIVRPVPQGGVLSIDVTLDSLSTFLAGQRISPRCRSFILYDNGGLSPHSDRAVAMMPDAAGQAPAWITIASSNDPILQEIWTNFATSRIAPDRNVTFMTGGETYFARIVALDRLGTPPFLVAMVAPLADFTGPIERARDQTLLLFVAAGALGLAFFTFVARLITRPLAGLGREADAIRRFELERPMTVSSHITEVASLATTMNAMKSTLRTFGLYVPKEIVRQLVSGDGQARLGAERRILTVMFTDIVGFTTIADGMDAEQLMRLTSEYFDRMTREIMGAGGVIDKYIGDAVMALWNAPGHDEAHAANGCLAALRCRDLSARMAQEFAEAGWPMMHTRIGVNTGEAVVGNVGSSDRISYTAIGTTVNTASRLEGLNKQYDTQILVTEATRAAAGANFVFRHVDRVLPKGRRTPVEIHELLGLRRAVEPKDAPLALTAEDIAWASDWDRIVKDYQERRFVDARLLLQTAHARRNDTVGRVFAQRLAAFIEAPPPDDWDGLPHIT